MGVPAFGVESTNTIVNAIGVVWVEEQMDEMIQLRDVDLEYITNHFSEHRVIITTFKNRAEVSPTNNQPVGPSVISLFLSLKTSGDDNGTDSN